MIKQVKIDRINELSKKSKTLEGLTDSEKTPQKSLREEYIAAFRENLKAQLDQIESVESIEEAEDADKCNIAQELEEKLN